MGTPEFSTGVLETTLKMTQLMWIVVVTQPDRAVGRADYYTNS